MNIKAKVIILLAAMAVTFLGFNLITCSGGFCKLLEAGQELSVLAANGCQGEPDAVVTAPARP